MKKIIDFVKKNYKIVIPAFIVLVLILVFIFYLIEVKNNNYREKHDYAFYQYIKENKYEFDMTLSTNKKGMLMDITPKNININFDATPIYYSTSTKVIFPKEVSVVFPMKTGAQYRVLKNSILTLKNDIAYLKTVNYDDKLQFAFIYDGSDMYFFIDEVTLNINDEAINLSPMSYIYLRYNDSIEYYDYANDKYVVRDLNGAKISVTNNYLDVNLVDDSINYFGSEVLLSPDFEYLDMIDKLKEK